MSQISLKRNILMSGSFRIIIMVLAFGVSVLATRYLGVELRGKYSYLYTLSGFIWMTLDMGLYRSYPYLVRKNPDKINVLFSWTLVQFIINIVVLPIIGISFVNLLSKLIGFSFHPILIIIFAFLIAFPQLNMQLQGLYLGLNKIWKHSLAQLINTLTVLIIIAIGYFFFKQMNRLAFMLIAIVLASAFSTLYYIINNKWTILLKKLDLAFIINSYKYGFRVFLSTLFILLLIRFDIILIKKMIGFKDVGIYSIAAHIIDLLQVASNLVGGLLLVKLTDSSDDIEKWNIMKKLLMSFFVLLVIANLGFIIAGRFLISAFYGIPFIPVYYVYLWLIPASFGLSFGSLFNMYLNSKGFPIISIILPVISLLTNILLNLLLIPHWGIKGAAIATSFSYVLWFVMIVMYEQHMSKKQMLRSLLPTYKDWILLYREVISLAKESLHKLKNTLLKKGQIEK